MAHAPTLRVLVLGAHGRIARVATRLFLDLTEADLTLYLRRAERLSRLRDDPRVRLVDGDVLDRATLRAAMQGQDVVYANLSGGLGAQARAVVETMGEAGLRRLVFVASMGIYGEVPGQGLHAALRPYREAADVIEGSGLDYTLLRPAWLSDRDEVDYGTTPKGAPFENPDGVVSRTSVAALVVQIATTPGLHVGESLGVHKPA